MPDQPSPSHALFAELDVARRMVERFVQDHGRPPSDIELRIANTLFIEAHKGSRGGGGRKRSGGGGSGNAPPPQQDRSIPILQRDVPRGKHKGVTWGQLSQTEPDYIEWAMANTNWFNDQEKAVLLNALSQGVANGGGGGHQASQPQARTPISQPDDDLPF
jgi:hypothetical protein